MLHKAGLCLIFKVILYSLRFVVLLKRHTYIKNLLPPQFIIITTFGTPTLPIEYTIHEMLQLEVNILNEIDMFFLYHITIFKNKNFTTKNYFHISSVTVLITLN